ncbi:MAG: hypothetical protein AB1942_21125 [Pseudomonadota bacterium]
MSAASDRLAAGYYNAGLYSNANPGGLSGKGAVRQNWTPMLADFSAVAGEAAGYAAQAGASAASAAQAPGTRATSTTNMSVPVAAGVDVTFQIQEADKLFSKSQTIVVGADASPLSFFKGPIKAWNPATRMMTVAVDFVAGAAGPYALWNVSLSSPSDNTLTGRVAALEAANLQARKRAALTAKEIF